MFDSLADCDDSSFESDDEPSVSFRLSQQTANEDDKAEPMSIPVVGQTLESLPSLPHPASLTDFEQLQLIGEGGYGKVLLVRLKQDPTRLFAMKILNKVGLTDKRHVANIRNERDILSAVKHPNVVRLHYAFQTARRLFLVLEYCRGGEIFFNLLQGRFGEKKARFYAANVVLALECFHQRSLVYRDLKPENVLIGDDGYARITDFGLSRKLAGDERCRSFCGTPEYMAPEVVSQAEYTRVVDWWALGVFIFEMVTGRPPFLDENRSALYKSIQNDEPASPGYLSVELRSLISQLLQKDPTKRLGNAQDAAEIKAHPWFKNVDWKLMEEKKVDPPFVPYVSSMCDTRNFDKSCTQTTVETGNEDAPSGNSDADVWKDFDYSEQLAR